MSSQVVQSLFPFNLHIDIFKMNLTSMGSPQLHACGCGKMNAPLSVQEA